MPFREWILKKENNTVWAHGVLLFAHLVRINPKKRFRILFHALGYLSGVLRWSLQLKIIHPLNALREKPLFLAIRKYFCERIPFLRKNYYRTELPANLQRQHKKNFANNFYYLKPLCIQHLLNYNIYLSAHTGIVFNNFHILTESIHGRWAKTRKVIFGNYYRQVMEAWLNARYENNATITELDDDKNYLLVHHWFNYYHWITESLVRLWQVKEDVRNYTLVLPESFLQVTFVTESLNVFGVKNIQWVKEDAVLQVPKLTLVQNKPYCNHYDPLQMQQMGLFFRNYSVAHPQTHEDFGDKIFITRKKAERRKMVNEDEIENLLTAYGFKTVALEDYSLLQEVSIMSKAKYLIGLHGAGLTNMLFMPPGGKVMELHRAIHTSNDMHSDVYWKLASALSHKYYYQFCAPADAAQNFFEADLLLDKHLFEENLKKFFS